MILLAALNIAWYLSYPLTRDSSGFLIWSTKTRMTLIYESTLLFSLSIGPLIVVGFSYRLLRQHRTSGRNHPNYEGVLISFIVTNVIVALCELCGTAIILRSVLLFKPETGTRNGVFLVRTCPCSSYVFSHVLGLYICSGTFYL